MKLFTAPDIYRVSKAADVESIRDAGLISLCIILLTTKLAEYTQWLQPSEPFTLKADPVTLGLRLLLYRKELESWREKHPDAIKFARTVLGNRDFTGMITYIWNSLNFLSNLIPR
jgi:hypothetical protein